VFFLVVHREDFSSHGTNSHTLEWEVSAPILTNKHILKQLFWVFQISVGFVLALIFLIQALDPFTEITLDFVIFLGQLYFITLGIMSVCLAIGYLIIMGSRYDFLFTLDSNGIMESHGRKQGRKNAIIYTLAIIGGLFSRNPGLAGAGLIAQSRQKNYISWQDVNKMEVDPRSRTIILKRNKRLLMIVFCTKENFEEVRERINNYLTWALPTTQS
jgi:hypothetical protein